MTTHTFAIVRAVVFCMLATTGFTVSAKVSPEQIPGSTRVSAEQFIELMQDIPNLTIIDSRIRADRKQGYVEGSKSLPDIETNCASLAEKIKEKAAPTLFYCNGVKCGRSAKALQVAIKCGYSNLYWFRGGFEEWLAKGYPYIQE